MAVANGVKACFSGLLLAGLAMAGSGALAGDLELGRAIYEKGILPSGELLVGERKGGQVKGAAAACATCHRRSGMGSVEGDILVSPVTGPALFRGDQRVIATMDPRRGKMFNRAHAPYDDASFAAAVRNGVEVGGRRMVPLMPRYRMSNEDIRVLKVYLEQLSTQWSPGVTADTIDFATIITPGVGAAERKALLDMAQATARYKNASIKPGHRYMTNAAELLLKTGRRWNIHVWELTGEPATWEAQLQAYYTAKPVFAVISGIGHGDWSPVAGFCESQQLPCMFPSLLAPPTAEARRYSFYYSRGVHLEADVLASHLKRSAARPGKLIQIHADDLVGQAAASQLKTALASSAWRDRLETRAAAAGDFARLVEQAAAQLGPDDVLMLWADKPALASLASLNAPAAGRVFFAGSLIAGDTSAVPASWRRAALVYPYELPEKRRANLAYLKAWLKLRNLPLVNEPVQSEIYFAFNFINDIVSDMLNNLYREYLIERVEDMVAFREGSKAEQELRDRAVLGRVTFRAKHEEGYAVPEARELLELGQKEKGISDQIGTTVYPRLSLAVGQRFASKGAYIVNYKSLEDDTIVPVGELVLP